MTMPHIHAIQLADGPDSPLVLSHALGLDHSMWQAFSHQYAGMRPVLAYDHRGHGDSDVAPGPYTMDQLVADAAQLLKRWNRGPVVWLGLSLGGMVGQGLAIRHPAALQGLVLAHTTSVYPAQAQANWAQRIHTVQHDGIAAVVDLVVQRYLAPEFQKRQPAVVQWLRQRLLATDATGYASSCAAVANVDWSAGLHRIQCPTLVLAGALDMGAPVAMSEQIHQGIAGSQLHVIDAASHLSPLECPAQFSALVNSFLASLPAVPRHA